jgi:hypothetical protein
MEKYKQVFVEKRIKGLKTTKEGASYFETRRDAKNYAETQNYPKYWIIEYGLGFAILLGDGDYVNVKKSK